VVVVGAFEQARNLDELGEHTVDAHQGWYRSQGSKGIVANLDLDVGQRVQQRGLPRVRRG
jgi:hypothetical protein